MSAEHNRQLQHMIQDGKVIEVDHANWQCRIKCNELTPDWMPMPTQRAGKAHIWSPLEVGEQVSYICVNGDPNHGRIIASFFTEGSGGMPPKHAKAGFFHINFENGDFLTHDDEGNMTVEVTKTFKVNAKDIELNAKDGIKLYAAAKDIEMNAKMQSVKIDAKDEFKAIAAAQVNIKAASSATIESEINTIIKSPANFSDAPTTFFAGGISQGKPTESRSIAARTIDFSIRLLGKMWINDLTAKGSIHADISITSSTQIKVKNVNLEDHKHTGVMKGGDLSGLPEKAQK